MVYRGKDGQIPAVPSGGKLKPVACADIGRLIVRSAAECRDLPSPIARGFPGTVALIPATGL